MNTLIKKEFPQITIPVQESSVYDSEIDYPLIEFDKNYYIYNFSYLPLPMFLSTSGKVDTKSMLLLPEYNDGEQLDYFNFNDIVQSKTIVVKTNVHANTIYIYSQQKEIFKLTEINNKKINKHIRPGLNIIRLIEPINQETSEFLFDTNFHNITSIQFYNSIYSKSFQFTIKQNVPNIYKIIQSDSQIIKINGSRIINNSFFQLSSNKNKEFTFDVTGENCFIEKIIVSKSTF